jgi:hypothetical protein
VFRGCFALYVRWTLDFVGDDQAPYSVCDLCPHAQHRPLPWGLENTFMSHAQHTGSSISALADTLWGIPSWAQLVSAAGDARAAGTAMAHVDENRSALVCGSAQLPQLLRLLHRHMAACHLYNLGNMVINKAARPAAQTREGGTITSGRHTFALEMAAPGTLLQDPDAPRLSLKVDNVAAPPAPADATLGAVDPANLEFLKQVLQEKVMAAPYAPCRMRSLVQLLSFPPPILNSMCAVMRQLPTAYPTFAQVSMVPAYVVEGRWVMVEWRCWPCAAVRQCSCWWCMQHTRWPVVLVVLVVWGCARRPRPS